MVKSFFDPGWMDIGILGSYGRWLGVNWVWTVELTIYHAVISIGIPILITTLLFPDRKDTAWVGNRLLGMDLRFLPAGCRLRLPGFNDLPAASGALPGCNSHHRRLDPVGETHSGPPARHRVDSPIASRFRFGLVAFIMTILFFATAWVLPNFGLPPVLPILLFGFIVWAAGAWIWHLSGRGNWQPPQLAALASGALAILHHPGTAG